MELHAALHAATSDEIDSQPGIPVTTTCQHKDHKVPKRRRQRFDSPVSNISSFYFDMFLSLGHMFLSVTAAVTLLLM